MMTETAFRPDTREAGKIDHHHTPLLRVMMINRLSPWDGPAYPALA